MKNLANLRKSAPTPKRTIKTPTKIGKLSRGTVKRVVKAVVTPKKK
jgi:hypothetical protein